MDGHIAAQERVSNPVLTFLRRLALEVERVEQLAMPLMASHFFKLADAAGIPIPGLSKDNEHNEEKAQMIIGMKMATVFKERQSVELDGFIVARTEESRYREDGQGGQYIVKTYTFDRIPQQPQ